jgi:hypothetical protein
MLMDVFWKRVWKVLYDAEWVHGLCMCGYVEEWYWG